MTDAFKAQPAMLELAVTWLKSTRRVQRPPDGRTAAAATASAKSAASVGADVAGTPAERSNVWGSLQTAGERGAVAPCQITTNSQPAHHDASQTLGTSSLFASTGGSAPTSMVQQEPSPLKQRHQQQQHQQQHHGMSLSPYSGNSHSALHRRSATFDAAQLHRDAPAAGAAPIRPPVVRRSVTLGGTRDTGQQQAATVVQLASSSSKQQQQMQRQELQKPRSSWTSWLGGLASSAGSGAQTSTSADGVVAAAATGVQTADDGSEGALSLLTSVVRLQRQLQEQESQLCTLQRQLTDSTRSHRQLVAQQAAYGRAALLHGALFIMHDCTGTGVQLVLLRVDVSRTPAAAGAGQAAGVHTSCQQAGRGSDGSSDAAGSEPTAVVAAQLDAKPVLPPALLKQQQQHHAQQVHGQLVIFAACSGAHGGAGSTDGDDGTAGKHASHAGSLHSRRRSLMGRLSPRSSSSTSSAQCSARDWRSLMMSGEIERSRVPCMHALWPAECWDVQPCWPSNLALRETAVVPLDARLSLRCQAGIGEPERLLLLQVPATGNGRGRDEWVEALSDWAAGE